MGDKWKWSGLVSDGRGWQPHMWVLCGGVPKKSIPRSRLGGEGKSGRGKGWNPGQGVRIPRLSSFDYLIHVNRKQKWMDNEASFLIAIYLQYGNSLHNFTCQCKYLCSISCSFQPNYIPNLPSSTPFCLLCVLVLFKYAYSRRKIDSCSVPFIPGQTIFPCKWTSLPWVNGVIHEPWN